MFNANITNKLVSFLKTDAGYLGDRGRREENSKNFKSFLSRADRLTDDDYEAELEKYVGIQTYLREERWSDRLAAIRSFCEQMFCQSQFGEIITKATWDELANEGVGVGFITDLLSSFDPDRYVHYDATFMNSLKTMGLNVQKMDYVAYNKLCNDCIELKEEMISEEIYDAKLDTVTYAILNCPFEYRRLFYTEEEIENIIVEKRSLMESKFFNRPYMARRDNIDFFRQISLNKLDNDVSSNYLDNILAKLQSFYREGKDAIEVVDSLGDIKKGELKKVIIASKNGVMNGTIWDEVLRLDLRLMGAITEILSYVDDKKYLYINSTLKMNICQGSLSWNDYQKWCSFFEKICSTMESEGYEHHNLTALALMLPNTLSELKKIEQKSAQSDDSDEYIQNIMQEVSPDIILDSEQIESVKSDDKYLLLVACAGSGKTTTIAAKVKYLVLRKKVSPEKILVTSFTRKAVNDIRETITKKIGLTPRIGTLHSVALNIRGNDAEIISFKPAIINKVLNGLIDSEGRYYDATFFKKFLIFANYLFDKRICSIQDSYMCMEEEQNGSHNKLLNKLLTKLINDRLNIFRSICGDYHDSRNEARFADLLYLKGIDYEYHPKKDGLSSDGNYIPTFLVKGIDGDVIIDCYHYYQQELLEKDDENFIGSNVVRYSFTYPTEREVKGEDIVNLLKKIGVFINERKGMEVFRKLMETDERECFAIINSLMDRFIALYKINREPAFEKLKEKAFDIRTVIFLEMMEKLYPSYQTYLRKVNKIDFEDMINDACDKLEEMKKSGKKLEYDYIIVDEYQDVASHKSDFIELIASVSDASIVAVGDDWQSIYSFAGSNMGYFKKFEQTHEGTAIKKITKTYRNSQELIDIAGEFILKNQTQIKKELTSDKHYKDPVRLVYYEDSRDEWDSLSETIVDIIERIVQEHGTGHRILILTRYRFEITRIKKSDHFKSSDADIDDNKDIIICDRCPDEEITIMTAHVSKGLTYDYVILASAANCQYGFPSKVTDDPIYSLLLVRDNSIPYAEERRLFYVALTRTKNEVYVVAPVSKPSEFIEELIQLGAKRMEDIEREGIKEMIEHRDKQRSEATKESIKPTLQTGLADDGVTPFYLINDDSHINVGESCIYHLTDYYKKDYCEVNNEPEFLENYESFKAIKNGRYDMNKDPLGLKIKIIGLLCSSSKWSLCSIPGHDKGSEEGNVIKIFRDCHLAINYNITKLLKRIVGIEPLHLSHAKRDYDTQYDSIAVTGDVTGKNIILVDDIATSGLTMIAARDRLLEAGANYVICIAIGKTKQ